MSQHLPPLIEALLTPRCYPELAQNIELVETHISWIFLVGDVAYKVKKPIQLSFLDYSTLELRKFYCEAEVRLNQRFSTGLYLGVVEICGTYDQPRVSDPNTNSGRAIEYAVKMRRFEEANRLDNICKAGNLTFDLVNQLAETVARFHELAVKAPISTNFGSLESVMCPPLENLEQLKLLLTSSDDMTVLRRLYEWTHYEYIRLAPQFSRRKAGGCIRECHGDLHLANVALVDGVVTLYDCIEFNEDFRWIDIASDIAFLYVDLLDHKQPGLAGWLISQWLSSTGNYESVSVLRYYSSYRALVRATVAAIRARQVQGDFSLTREYVALAQQLTQPSTPTLTITYGLSGSGKTVAAKAKVTADPFGTTLCVRSDIERKRLFGLAATEHSRSPVGEGIYSHDANILTYQYLYRVAAELLKEGWSVVVDAAFLKHSERAAFHELAIQLKLKFIILAPTVTYDQLEARILKRLQCGQDASEANLEVLRSQKQIIEPLDDIERAWVLNN